MNNGEIRSLSKPVSGKEIGAGRKFEKYNHYRDDEQ